MPSKTHNQMTYQIKDKAKNPKSTDPGQCSASQMEGPNNGNSDLVYFTSTLCKSYVSFLSTLPFTTTAHLPKKGEATKMNGRIQFDDPEFAENLQNATRLSSHSSWNFRMTRSPGKRDISNARNFVGRSRDRIEFQNPLSIATRRANSSHNIIGRPESRSRPPLHLCFFDQSAPCFNCVHLHCSPKKYS